MATDIAKLIQEVQSLDADELRRLRSAVDERLAHSPAPAPSGELEDEFKRRLLAAGLLKEVRPPVSDPVPYHSRTPVPVQGMPVSLTVVEERR